MNWYLSWLRTCLSNSFQPSAFLFAILLQTIVVAGVALLLVRLWPHHPARQHNVLLSAVLCLLLTPFLYIGVSWTGFFIDVSPSQIASSSEAEPLALHARDALDLRSRVLRQEMIALDEIKAIGRLRRHNWTVAASSICLTWAIISSVRFLGLIRSLRAMRNVYDRATPIERAEYELEIDSARRVLGLAAYPEICTADVAGPMVAGLFGARRVLLPADLFDDVDANELTQILVHEGAHAMRHDSLTLLAQEFCLALYWWHPLVQAVVRELCRTREEVCDNFVLGELDGQHYAQTLFKRALAGPSPGLAIGFTSERGSLEQRIQRILSENISRHTNTTLLFSLSMFTLLCTLCIVAGGTRHSAAQPMSVQQHHRLVLKQEGRIAQILKQVHEASAAKRSRAGFKIAVSPQSKSRARERLSELSKAMLVAPVSVDPGDTRSVKLLEKELAVTHLRLAHTQYRIRQLEAAIDAAPE